FCAILIGQSPSIATRQHRSQKLNADGNADHGIAIAQFMMNKQRDNRQRQPYGHVGEKNRKSDAEERKIGRRSCFGLAYSSHALLQNAAQGEEYPRLISLVSGL